MRWRCCARPNSPRTAIRHRARRAERHRSDAPAASRRCSSRCPTSSPTSWCSIRRSTSSCMPSTAPSTSSARTSTSPSGRTPIRCRIPTWCSGRSHRRRGSCSRAPTTSTNTASRDKPQDLRDHPSLFMMRSGVDPVWRLRHARQAKNEVVMPLTPRLLQRRHGRLAAGRDQGPRDRGASGLYLPGGGARSGAAAARAAELDRRRLHDHRADSLPAGTAALGPRLPRSSGGRVSEDRADVGRPIHLDARSQICAAFRPTSPQLGCGQRCRLRLEHER